MKNIQGRVIFFVGVGKGFGVRPGVRQPVLFPLASLPTPDIDYHSADPNEPV